MSVNGSFGKPFAQQVAAFRLRLGNLVSTETWTDIWQAQHDRAFMVAGATKAELLADLAVAVYKAIVQGTTLETFRKDFAEITARNGWTSYTGSTTAKGRAWRTRVIYKTNLSVSYAAGRYAQLVEGNFPFWVYRHGGSLDPREQHLAWDGLILPPDHPFWATHAPPNGWGCSCYIVGARSRESARRVGGKPELTLPDNWQALDPRTGAPTGIDRGWAYAPGASVARTVAAIADKVAGLPAMTGAQMVNEWPDKLFPMLSEAFQTWLGVVQNDLPRGRSMVIGALRPEWIVAAKSRGLTPATAEITVLEADVRHIFRQVKAARGKMLDAQWFKELPVHLRKPDAVILETVDPDRPSLLLLYGSGPDTPKLVIRIDYEGGKRGKLNIVKSGQRVNTEGIIIGQNYELIAGSL